MSARKRPPDVYLTGFMGAGKSTAGRLLAHRLGWEFVDLDEMIEQRAGKTIEQIFAQHGEAAFRRIESDALLEVIGQSDIEGRVVALGGGTLSRRENLRRISRSAGVLVFLEADADTLLRRCREDSGRRVRPLAADDNQFRKLLEKRRASYLETGTKINTSNRTVDDVVEEIERHIALATSSRVKEKHGA